MAKKIGFRQYNEPEDEKKEAPEEDCLNLFKEHIEKHYRPFGKTEDKVFKTSQELIYEMGGIVEGISPATLAKILHAAGYKIEHVGGFPYWVLYEIFNPDTELYI